VAKDRLSSDEKIVAKRWKKQMPNGRKIDAKWQKKVLLNIRI
jgi:hypothetical protein